MTDPGDQSKLLLFFSEAPAEHPVADPIPTARISWLDPTDGTVTLFYEGHLEDVAYSLAPLWPGGYGSVVPGQYPVLLAVMWDGTAMGYRIGRFQHDGTTYWDLYTIAIDLFLSYSIPQLACSPSGSECFVSEDVGGVINIYVFDGQTSAFDALTAMVVSGAINEPTDAWVYSLYALPSTASGVNFAGPVTSMAMSPGGEALYLSDGYTIREWLRSTDSVALVAGSTESNAHPTSGPIVLGDADWDGILERQGIHAAGPIAVSAAGNRLTVVRSDLGVDTAGVLDLVGDGWAVCPADGGYCDGTDRVCRCNANFYASYEFGLFTCRRCSACSAFEVMESQCTATSDVQCTRGCGRRETTLIDRPTQLPSSTPGFQPPLSAPTPIFALSSSTLLLGGLDGVYAVSLVSGDERGSPMISYVIQVWHPCCTVTHAVTDMGDLVQVYW